MKHIFSAHVIAVALAAIALSAFFHGKDIVAGVCTVALVVGVFVMGSVMAKHNG